MTLAQTLQAAGQSQEAAQVYQEVLKFDERSLPARYALSEYWYDRGAITRAMYELEQITRIDSRQTRAWVRLGQHSLDFGLLTDAQRQLRGALETEPDPDTRQQICLDLGLCLFQQREYEEAVELLRQAARSGAASACQAEALAALGREEEITQAWSALGETAQADAARARFAELDRLADRYTELNTQAGDRQDDIALRRELATLAEQLGRKTQAEAWRRAARLIEQQKQQQQ